MRDRDALANVRSVKAHPLRSASFAVVLFASVTPSASVPAQERQTVNADDRPHFTARCGVGVPSSEQRGYVPLPRGDVFCPLVADPKAAQSFVSYLREDSKSASPDTSIDIASIGIGDSFGIGRWGGSRAGDGVQLSLSGGVFAQFDLGSPSYDLLNADYFIAIPVTVRRGRFSSRIRVYHQSSHLGDELLLRENSNGLEREDLSFEAIEVIVSTDVHALRLYGGGEYLLRRVPADLEQYVAHAGAELRPMVRILPLGDLGGFRFLAAADLKASQEQDWDPSVSVRAGFEYDRSTFRDAPARRWRLLFEYYRGPSPYGQFFRSDVRHIGVGLHFGL